jgi:alpha-mannosidase
VRDTADPWGMQVRAFRDVVAHFGPLPSEEAAVFCGVSRLLPAVRVIESGKVRTIVEAVLGFGRSALALRYKLPSVGAEIEVEVLVSWFERDRMLKLAVPTRLRGRVLRQTAYGVDPSDRPGEEEVWHRWMAVTDANDRFALSLVNDRVYGFDAQHGDVRVSLLRAPAYAGHPIDEATPIVRQDRFEPREDQGLHAFRFWLNAGDARTRLDLVGREAAARTSAPMALNAFPEGGGTRPLPGVRLEDAVVQTGCVKLSEDGRRLLVRLFEPTGTPRTTKLLVPGLDVACAVSLAAFEIATVAIDLETRRVERTDLLERPVPPSSQGVRL